MTDERDATDRFIAAWPSTLSRSDELVAAVDAAVAAVGLDSVLQVARAVATEAEVARMRTGRKIEPDGPMRLLQLAAESGGA